MTHKPVDVFVSSRGNAFMTDIARWIVEAAEQAGRAATLVCDRLPTPSDAINLVVAPHELFVLDDDKHYFPPYEAVPVIRQEIVTKHPEVRRAFAELAGKISDQAMRKMNYLVDGEHRNVSDVVREFLDSTQRTNGRVP